MDKNATKFLTSDTKVPPYIMFPRFLFDSRLSETTKLLYIALLDRAKLSMKNEGWIDEKGNIFIYFTIENMSKLLRKGETTIKNSLSALAKEELILRKRQGAGKPNRIYVKVPVNCLLQSETVEKATERRIENCLDNSQKNDLMTVKKLPTNKNKYNNNNLTIRTYEYKEGESL